MTQNINELILSSDSDDFNHPNIDKKSFIDFKRRQKAELKQQKAKRLEEINILLQKKFDENLVKEKEQLEFDLKEKITEKESQMLINSKEEPEMEEERLFQVIIDALNCRDLGEFVTFLDNNMDINLEYLEQQILYNLSEAIKEGNDDLGMDFSRISVYIKYALKEGRNFMIKLMMALNDENKRKLFDEECLMCYEEAKRMILDLNK